MPGYKNGQKCAAHLPSTGNNKEIRERYVMKRGERHCSLSAMHSGIIPLCSAAALMNYKTQGCKPGWESRPELLF